MHDPTGHAEINCIRRECARLGSDDMYDYILFSTLEPCHMCLSCAAWARIPTVYFGAYRRDVDSSLFETIHHAGDEKEAAHMNLRENRQMHVRGGVLEAECASLLAGYHDRHHHTPEPATL
jgi:tRNA(Arg) A34 adenosine deaminase TadA